MPMTPSYPGTATENVAAYLADIREMVASIAADLRPFFRSHEEASPPASAPGWVGASKLMVCPAIVVAALQMWLDANHCAGSAPEFTSVEFNSTDRTFAVSVIGSDVTS